MLPRQLQLFYLLLPFASLYASAQSFENSAIVRTIELSGSLIHVTTTYAAKALEPDAKVYTIALGKDELAKTSWLEPKLKGQQEALEITDHEGDETSCSECHLFDIILPKALSVGSTANIVIETVQTHATWPWPPTAAQSEEQALKYEMDLFVVSPYATNVQRTKIKASSPKIIAYTTPKDVETFTMEDPVTKSGATITYGPYNNIPSSASDAFIFGMQQRILIHYTHDYPVLEVTELKRAAEISHWGANLNIQDEIGLHNAGPKLKGQFSRLEHQSQSFFQRPAPHVLPSLTLHLPPGISNTYYYDLIGNVSTSHLRVGKPSLIQSRPQYSVLELKPRYPLIGGWNYSFTLGWDAALGDSVVYDKSTGKYIARIPIMTEIPSAVVNNAEVKIILPEGAVDISSEAPFPAISTQVTKHTTYLDTIGRPALVFKYKDLTDRHAQSIYVSYRVPFTAHLKKPMAVATVFLSLFTFALVGRRIDLTITKGQKV